MGSWWVAAFFKLPSGDRIASSLYFCCDVREWLGIDVCSLPPEAIAVSEKAELVKIELTYDETTAVIGSIDTRHLLTRSATRKICDALRNWQVANLVGEGDLMSEISEQEWLKASASNPVFDFLNNPEEDIYTSADGKAMTEKLETWYVFDMNPESVDPRLPQWLEQHGIVMKVNAEGKTPGVIANTLDDLPEYCHPIPAEVKPALPLKIMLSPIELIPDLRELVDHHDSIHGKPCRFIRDPLGEDFGRGAKLADLLECLQGWLSEISTILSRAERCDRVAFNYEGEEEIETIKAAIASLKTEYFEANSTFSDEDVKARIFRFNTEEARKQQKDE